MTGKGFENIDFHRDFAAAIGFSLGQCHSARDLPPCGIASSMMPDRITSRCYPMPSPARRRYRPESYLHLESLEGRLVLAASVGLDRFGTLRITGSQSDDSVTVSVQRTKVVVTQTAAAAKVFALGRVRSIAFSGLAGDDAFTNHTAIRCVADGGAGNDVLRGGANRDVLRGGDDADTLVGNGQDDTLDGGRGDDKLFGGGGHDTLAGGDGNDDIRGEDGNDRMSGGSGDDLIEGGRGDDVAGGDGGDDAMYGGVGNDDLYGGDDDDLLAGNSGNDDLFGQAGDDSLDGDEGDDRLFGGSGTDEDLDDEDAFEDEDEGEDEQEHENEPPAGALPITFSEAGLAQLLGTSLNHADKKFHVFTATQTGSLAVSLVRVGASAYADLEVEQAGVDGHLLELEPHEGRPSSGTVTIVAGRTYSLRLRSPVTTPVEYRVDLAFTAAT